MIQLCNFFVTSVFSLSESILCRLVPLQLQFTDPETGDFGYSSLKIADLH